MPTSKGSSGLKNFIKKYGLWNEDQSKSAAAVLRKIQDLGLESIAKTNYNHVSHRIIDKKWDEEDEDWNYLPKGDQNALHDGCFIKSKDIKYKLEMLIKINN